MGKAVVILPKKTIDITIDENDYTIKFPNNGQFIEIEALKSRLTRDRYNSMTEGNTTSSLMARYLVDMIAFFSICGTDIKKDLKVDTFSDLEMIDTKKILKVYYKEILPWLTEWELVLNADDDEAETEK